MLLVVSLLAVSLAIFSEPYNIVEWSLPPKAVGIVMKAVPTRTTMNILECILIDATTNEIKFTGNDMELGIETIVEGEIIEKGKVAIDAKLFSIKL